MGSILIPSFHFSTHNILIDNSEEIANEFNNFIVSIGHN